MVASRVFQMVKRIMSGALTMGTMDVRIDGSKGWLISADCNATHLEHHPRMAYPLMPGVLKLRSAPPRSCF